MPEVLTTPLSHLKAIRAFGFHALLLAAMAWLTSAGLVFGIDPSENERKLAQLITSHPGQKRAEMIHDPILHLVARAKALDLGRRNYAGHVDPDGYGPNEAVKAAAYGLPAWWESQTNKASNNVESLGFGFGGSHATIFNQWMNSTLHRNHVLSESEFFRNQTHYAVGHAEVSGSTYTHYYVFISAPPPTGPITELEPYVEWLFERYSIEDILTNGDKTDTDGDGLSRLLEFALGLDPNKKDTIPPLVFPAGVDQLEWHFPEQNSLGSVNLRAEYSKDLQVWDGEVIRRENDRFVLDRRERHGFLRLKAEFPWPRP